MAGLRCPRCDAEQASGTNFCTRCGYDLAPVSPSEPAQPRPGAQPGFVACHTCGATNAASRRRCGRCGVDLSGQADAGAAPPEEPGPEEEVWPEESGSPVVFIAAITVAALAIVGVIVTILSASGIGFQPDPDETPAQDDEVVLPVSSVRASSVLSPSGGADHEPENLLDGDPATPWREAASGDGIGEWVELELEGSPEVSRLLIWNGDQRDGRYGATSRASRVRIELGDRTFTADLLDVEGPQAVDLPELVEAPSVRVTIVAVVEGSGDSDVALSDIEVRGPPPPSSDAEASTS